MSRQLAAIMFTDIVGYTALMGESEHQAMQALEQYKSIAAPIVEVNQGKWLKDLGDGAICSFGSALAAVNAAIAIQQKANQDMDVKIRIGIHTGDVTFKGGDVFGDGVNIASRIQGEAASGGICLSEPVYKSVNNQQNIQVKYLGKRQLKNVKGPMRLYQVTNPGVEYTRNKPQKTILLWQAIVMALLLAGLFSVITYRAFNAPTIALPKEVERFDIVLPEDQPLTLIGAAQFGIGQTALAISPDGKVLAYTAQEEETTRLSIRSFDSYQVTVLMGTEGAFAPFFSPDGKWIGYFAQGFLKKVPVGGGTPLILCEASNPNGGTWTADGKIIFADSEGSGLKWLPQEGGDVQVLRVEGARGYFGEFSYPSVLNDKYLLVGSSAPRGIDAISLDSGNRVRLIDQGGDPHYSSTGHLLFTRYGRLMMIRFDPVSLRAHGEAVSVIDDLRTELTAGQFAFSEQGTLVYVPGISAIRTNLVWRYFEGVESALPLGSDYYGQVRISPDGENLAITNQDNRDIYSYHIPSQTTNRLTSDGRNLSPVWGPGPGDISYFNNNNIRAAPASGAKDPKIIIDTTAFPHDWSHDGQVLMYGKSSAESGADIWFHFVDQSREDLLLTPNRSTETLAKFSPEANYVAYTSSESGEYEVYVQPFPPTGDRWTVSSEGGEEPVWSPNGKKLYYRNTNDWIEVEITTAPVFSIGKRRVLFSEPYMNVPGFSYDISPDGQRFLLLKPVSQERTTTNLRIIKNWFEVINQLTPQPSE